MQKKSWLLLSVLVILLSVTAIVIYWRKNKLQSKLSQQIDFTEQEIVSNQYPIIPDRGEIIAPIQGLDVSSAIDDEGRALAYWLECQIEQINQYRNYRRAPIIPGDWRVIADIACSYFNVQGEVEIIYLPLHIYHPEKQEYLLVGTDMQIEPDEDLIRQIAEITSLAWYEGMTETFWGESLAVGKTIQIDLDYPTPELRLEKTRGAAFETLLEPNPPYTREDLTNFYQTGNAQLLPEVNGKHYFWPVVRYLLK